MIPSVSTLTLDTEAFPDWWTNFLWSTLIGKYNSQSPWAVLIGQMGLDKKKEQGSSFKVTHEKRQCTDAWYRKGNIYIYIYIIYHFIKLDGSHKSKNKN